MASEPRAITLYETLLAGCNAKAEEVGDSDGEFGTFAGLATTAFRSHGVPATVCPWLPFPSTQIRS
jgi:hypothetical protein